jgi:hypothetical protein
MPHLNLKLEEWNLSNEFSEIFDLPQMESLDLGKLSLREIRRRMENFLKKIDPKNWEGWYRKSLHRIKALPTKWRSNIFIAITGIFLAGLSIEKIENIIKSEKPWAQIGGELVKLMPRADFHKAQEFVKFHEGEYSADPRDAGNWVVNSSGKKILIGTKWGISAPVLATHWGRTPKSHRPDTSIHILSN